MIFGLYRDILAYCGVALTRDTRIVDWGCGSGAMVKEGRSAGYDVVGCDFSVELGKDPHLSAIDPQTYRLPYPDNSFDVLISSSVLEHVMDYDTSLAELHRVIKPGGAFLHMFPSRFTPIEPHIYVPGATIIRSKPWLLLWAALGVRNQFQFGMSMTASAQTNYHWLRQHTNYLNRHELIRRFRQHFAEVHFVEDAFLNVRHGLNLPVLPWLYSTFRNRVVFGRAQLPLAR